MLLMPVLRIDDLSDAVLDALRQRAVRHGRSLDAEVRALLEEAVKPQGRLKLGSLLADIGRQAKLTDEEVTLINQRDQSLPCPVNFE
ncbi:FitA-like ribbon-helix-helix domain-containing protein [Sinimarinibacterium thermocellulolyticum]|uniref:Arc family DNA-binding protein n=1 Tax=Sinimarinibacterium thermocellulolyticum TaxID=3170016 RepID=A0ABV2ACV6_9GAMM